MTWRSSAMGAVALGAFVGLLAGARSVLADDRGGALAILPALEADTAHKPWTEAAVKASRDSLERATRMRTAGDDVHARLAEGLALEWAETARDLAEAADAEKKQREVELSAIEAGARVERERALLEEAIARSGRLKTELEAAHQAASRPKERTAVIEGATKPKTAAKVSAADVDAPAAPAPPKGATSGTKGPTR